MGRVALLAFLAAASSCGGPAPAADAQPDPFVAAAQDLYGLQVGARWTYLRSGDVLRWKEITACEDVLLLDVDTGQPRTVRAYVRENRGVFGVTSVHYLIVDDTGVLRVRRDDVDEGNLVTLSMYDPPSPRLLEGPYRTGDVFAFELRTAEFEALDHWYRGATDTSAVDEVLGEENLLVVAGWFRTVAIERQWTANNAHNVVSHYAAGVGEVREQTIWPTEPLPTIQIEELIDYTPGYGSCEGTPRTEVTSCAAPLMECDNPWDTGVPGCADPRVDPANCGSCGNRCPGGVCAGGVCVIGNGACAAPCEGSTVCCPEAWNWGWGQPGCTSPARDRWNCGGCGIACDPGLICDHGECTCRPGTRACGGGGWVDVLSDPANCGECGSTCGGDTPICDKGICVENCLSVDLVECGDACVDLGWNDAHCGACGRACGDGTGTTTCAYGECITCAAAGLTDCSGDCEDLTWSEKNCGACGTRCAADQVCVFGDCVSGDGSCMDPCPDEQLCCLGECINPRTSDHHCGGCGIDQCAGGCTEACRDGACTQADCGGGDD